MSNLLSHDTHRQQLPMARLNRQKSHDLLRQKHSVAPAPLSSKSTHIATRSNSASSTESFNSKPRHSVSSACSNDTSLTTPRSSLTTTTLGERVRVDSLQMTGYLRFLGTTQFKQGIWAGIELDTVGAGKNDGSVQGIRYFSCPPKTGIFVLASKVQPVDTHHQARHPTITPGSRASRFVDLTASQLTQQLQLRKAPRSKHTPPSPSLQRPSLGLPSPEITPTQTRPDFTPLSQSTKDQSIPDGILEPTQPLSEAIHPLRCPTCEQKQQKLDQLLADQQEQQVKVDEAHARIRELEQTVEDLKRAGMESIDLYETAIKRHSAAVKKHKATLDAAHAQIEQLELEQEKWQTLVAQCEADRVRMEKVHARQQDELELTIRHLEEQVAQLCPREQLESLEQAMNTYRQQAADDLAAAQQALADERLAHQATLSDLQVKRLEIQQRHQEEMALAKETHAQLRESNNTLEQELKTVRDKLVQAEAALKGMQEKQDEWEKQKKQLQADHTQLSQSNEQLDAENQQLKKQLKELPPRPPGASDPLLWQQLVEAQQEIKSMREQHASTINEIMEKHAKQERQHEKETLILHRDISELESLIEAKIFREADLQEALEQERRLVQQLLQERQLNEFRGNRSSLGSVHSNSYPIFHAASDTRRRATTRSSSSITSFTILEEDDTPYCDLCKTAGHDLMGCPSLLGLPLTKNDHCPETRACCELDATSIPQHQNEVF